MSLRNMPPLAAAATECRISGSAKMDRKPNPDKDHKCTVRMHGDLVVRYKVRTAGGPALPVARTVRQEAPRRFDQSFDLYDPDTFFRSYTACRDAIHQMLMQTPLLRELDLSADNWDYFMPHELATITVGFVRRELRGVVAVRYSLDMNLTIWADIYYDEPKALLLACCTAVSPPPAEWGCCICMEEDLAAGRDTVRLPCSHSFHRDCIAPWFYKAATCPMCRHDVSNHLLAATNTPKGNFPGLQT